LCWIKHPAFAPRRPERARVTASEPLTPDALTSLELFVGLAPAELEAVMRLARVRRMPKDVQIFAQGDAALHAHALIHGSVSIRQSGSDGGDVVVRFIGPGEMFGTVALFTDGLYPADAVMLADSLEVSWCKADLFELMERYPTIAINVIRIIGKRLQEAQERVRELSTQRDEQRVAHAVMRLARQAGQSTLDGTAIEFPLRRKDVADLSGTTLHTASRILTAWEKAGLVASDHQHLIIRKPAELLRIADDWAH